MIKPEQVPTGVVAVFDAVWEMTRRTDKALAAALNAWSGIERVPGDHEVKPYLILPLPPPPAGETE